MPTASTPAEEEFPLIISVDDHILEPRELWERELPASLRSRGPRCVREKTKSTFKGGVLTMERDVQDGHWTDVWIFDDLVMGTNRLHAAGGMPLEWHENLPAIYEDFRPGAYDQAARLADMDANHQQVGINYPNTFPRFAGQGFAERSDKDLALISLQIYNDWMIEEWCGGAGRGRLIPLTLIPLWDPVAAAAEVRRCAAKGSHAIAFSENPAKLGFSSLYTGDWDALWAACEETDTTISMHIGSSSSMPTTSADAPLAVSMSLNATMPKVRSVTGSTAARWSASQTCGSPTPKARSAGCPSNTSAWTASGMNRWATSICPSHHRAICVAASSVASSTISTGCAAGTRWA